MSEINNDNWLDEIISKTINTKKTEFDAEKFKQKFPEELQMLQSQANKSSIRQIQWTKYFKNPIVKFAAAAVIIFSIGLFLYKLMPDDIVNKGYTIHKVKTPSELLTSTSLLKAYLQGGMEALDAQNRKVAQMLNRKSKDITMHELLAENNSI